MDSTIRYPGFHDLAAYDGNELENGWHIRCSQSLHYMWNNPDDVCVPFNEKYGNFLNALTEFDWDVVTFQPFDGREDGVYVTPDQEIEALVNMVSLIDDKETRIVLYTTWSSIPQFRNEYSETKYRDVWEAPYTATSRVTRSREFFTLFTNKAKRRIEAMGYPVEVIAAGEVVASMESAIEAGNLVGIDYVDEVFRDYIHMNGIGRYAVALAMYATLFNRENVNGLPLPDYYVDYDTTPKPTLEMVEPIQAIVNNVLSSDTFSAESVPLETECINRLFRWNAVWGFEYDIYESEDLKKWELGLRAEGSGVWESYEMLPGYFYQLKRR